MGPRSWESFQGPLARCQVQLLISFGGIGLLSMEDCAPSVFLGNWVLVVLYLCSRFCICALGFVFLIDPFRRSTFIILGKVHTCFSHAYVQFEMTFFL
jgi:hypothetical protein